MILSPSTSPLISQTQLDFFHEQGYVVVDDLFSGEQLQAIEDFFEDFRLHGDRAFTEGGAEKYEDIDPRKRQVRAMHPHRYDRRVMDWYLNPKVMDVLEVLLGRPALGAQTMYYYKPPGAKGQGMHQDNFYLVAKPATCIAAWTPIDDATEENGCLWVGPGSHRDDIYCPQKDAPSEPWNRYGDSHINPYPRHRKPVPVPVRRGQTMFFGGNLIHGSGPNRSQERWRRTFIGHYVDEAAEELGRHYHPVVNRHGEAVTSVESVNHGGPCGDGKGNLVH
ncbi:MAG: phytanoyl-CoA dioxygenase family protein [Verrucomicrobiota bacterium]